MGRKHHLIEDARLSDYVPRNMLDRFSMNMWSSAEREKMEAYNDEYLEKAGYTNVFIQLWLTLYESPENAKRKLLVFTADQRALTSIYVKAMTRDRVGVFADET